MWWENPAVGMFVKDNYIISTTETASGMRKSLPKLAALALKLAKKKKLKRQDLKDTFLQDIVIMNIMKKQVQDVLQISC